MNRIAMSAIACFYRESVSMGWVSFSHAVEQLALIYDISLDHAFLLLGSPEGLHESVGAETGPLGLAK